MAVLNVRDLPDEVMAKLKARAARNDRSVAAEARRILSDAVAGERPAGSFAAWAMEVRGSLGLPPAEPGTAVRLLREEREEREARIEAAMRGEPGEDPLRSDEDGPGR